MLNFVLVTRNEGSELDRFLGMLSTVMEPKDNLVAIDTGSTDRTNARLLEFAEHSACDVIRLDAQTLSHAEALALALDAGRAPYYMLVSARDTLRPSDLSALRRKLRDFAPDLAVINTGWWYADPSRLLQRVDSPYANSTSQQPAIETLLGLCPDPRRLLISREAATTFRAVLSQKLSAAALYCALVSAARTPLFFPSTTVLHARDHVDPTPQLEVLVSQLSASQTPDQSMVLQRITVWADDAVLRTGPAQARQLCAKLLQVLRALPRSMRRGVYDHPGPSGPLFAALHRGSEREAVLEFALAALTMQLQQTEQLADEYAQLQHSVRAALPGPDYLRRLYERVRNL